MSPKPEINREDPDRNEGEDAEISSVDAPQFIIAGGSSEDEEEESLNPDGYQMLPQDVDDSDEAGDGEQDTSVVAPMGGEQASATPNFTAVGLGSNFELPRKPQEVEFKVLWNNVPTHHEPLNDEQVDKIKAAMQNIKLPKQSIPNWAEVVPEEKWKAELLEKFGKPCDKKEEKDTAESQESGEDSKRDQEESL